MGKTEQLSQVTPKQLEVLKEIARFEARRCYSATIGEVAEKLGTSRTTVFEHIAALREKGLVTRSKGKARSSRLTKPANRLLEQIEDRDILPEFADDGDVDPGGIPLVGRVAAGEPIEAIENVESFTLKSLFGSDDDIFALEVVGDSMIDEGIFSGDRVICKKAKTAANGQMVVAIVDDESATLKRFYKEADRVRLQPANDAYDPIYSDNCRIEGVVLGLLKEF
ncbi:MAG: transcriptional repressor LexA [Anaerohalosphaera sp.]|nr:transcriptional repressor LexA [Anaerohalosphaera sp.]